MAKKRKEQYPKFIDTQSELGRQFLSSIVIDFGASHVSEVDMVLGFAFSENKDDVVLQDRNQPLPLAGLLNGLEGRIHPGQDSYDVMADKFERKTGVPTDSEQWHHFATLRKMDFKNKIPTNIHVFCLFNDAVIDAVRHQLPKAEDIQILNVNDADITDRSAPDVPWLIMYARTADVTNRLVTVRSNPNFVN